MQLTRLEYTALAAVARRGGLTIVALVVLALRPALFVVWVFLNLMSVLGGFVMPLGVMAIRALPRTAGDALATGSMFSQPLSEMNGNQ